MWRTISILTTSLYALTAVFFQTAVQEDESMVVGAVIVATAIDKMK